MVSEMTQKECHAILTANTIGRLACVRGGTPYVVPTSYVYEGRHIYSFSLIGLKIRAMRSDPQACFEVDEIKSPRNWWSVLAFGTYEELTESDHWRNERDMPGLSFRRHVRTGGALEVRSRLDFWPSSRCHRIFSFASMSNGSLGVAGSSE